MKKDFITVTPDSGGGAASVNMQADPNLGFSERSTTLNFSPTGGSPMRAVNAVQSGITWLLVKPFFMQTPQDNNNSVLNWTYNPQSNGTLLISMPVEDFQEMLSMQNNVMFYGVIWCPTATSISVKFNTGIQLTKKSGGIFYVSQSVYNQILEQLITWNPDNQSVDIIIDGEIVLKYTFTN